MRLISARTAARSFGELIADAEHAPVTVLRHGRPSVVVIGHALFKEYEKAYEKARDVQMISLLEQSLDHLVAGRLGKSGRALALMERIKSRQEKGVVE